MVLLQIKSKIYRQVEGATCQCQTGACDARDYLLAGGSMSPLPVAFSLMASFMSAITLLGVTFENYTFGTQFMVINLSYAIGKA